MNALKTRRRIVLVDDHTAFVDLLQFAFGGLDDMECVGTAHSVEEAEAVVAAEHPDIAMVDLMLGDDDGLELVRRLRAARPDLVIVVASAWADASTMASVAAAGGNGFAPKRGALAELLTILRSARPGTMSVASSLEAAVTPPGPPAPVRPAHRPGGAGAGADGPRAPRSRPSPSGSTSA
ncbi:MAG TPA: response regulator [Mycobacteriales bacterium]